MHVDDEQIQRLLHGELSAPAEETIRTHLTGCDDCRRVVEQARHEEEWLVDLLRRVNHAPPRTSAETVAARARREATGWFRWAAGIVLALGVAGASYALPGSPVRAWVQRVADRIGEPAPRSSVPAPGSVSSSAATPTTPLDRETAGVAVAPDERFTIVLGPERTRGTVRVSLTDGAEIVARAVNGTATFTSSVDQLMIVTGGAEAAYEIELPRSAPWVEIRVGEQRLLLKEGPHVTTAAPADAQGRYLVQLVPPRE